MIKGATIITHYPKSDPKMHGDYYDIEIYCYLKDGTHIHMEYGDYYHDKGSAKMEGFVDALNLLSGKRIPLIKERVADREEW